MQVYISQFYNIRFFTPNMIPISTTGGDPMWYHDNTRDQSICFVDKNNVMNGIREPALAFHPGYSAPLTEMCDKNCRFKSKVPHCQFMDAYRNYLRTVDFNYLYSEFNRVAEDVRKVTHFIGEPIIVLMVYEKADVPCAERPCLRDVFKDHGIELKEWTKDLLEYSCIF